MPRPARQEVHRHFSPIRQAVPAEDDATKTDDASELAPDAEGRVLKHPRVRCKHCSWKSKRDASRQAKHLEACAPYRQWAEANGEPLIGSEEAARAALEERQARRRSGRTPVGGPEAERSNLFARSPLEVSRQAPGQQQQQQQQQGSSRASPVGMPSLPPPPLMRPPSNPGHAASAYAGGGIQVLGEAERRRLDLLYARALVAEGTDAEGKPHDLYDRQKHPQMWAFLKALNPGYEPPSREVLGQLVMREFFGMSGGNGATSPGV